MLDAGSVIVALTRYPDPHEQGEWRQLSTIAADLISEEQRNPKSGYESGTVFATEKQHNQVSLTQKGHPGALILARNLPEVHVFLFAFMLGADLIVREHAELDGKPVYACWQREFGLWAITKKNGIYQGAPRHLVTDLVPRTPHIASSMLH